MTEMGDLSITLNDMGFVQLVLAFAFLISYALAIGGMFGALGRRRAAVAALAAAIGFAAMTKPWVHGALLVVFAIAGVGLFITLTWALSLLFGAAHTSATSVTDAPDVAEFAEITAAAALVDVEVPAVSNDPRLGATAIAASQPGGAHTS